MSVVVDALGKQCPIPVVMAKKALAELKTPDTLEILVDIPENWKMFLLLM